MSFAVMQDGRACPFLDVLGSEATFGLSGRDSTISTLSPGPSIFWKDFLDLRSLSVEIRVRVATTVDDSLLKRC